MSPVGAGLNRVGRWASVPPLGAVALIVAGGLVGYALGGAALSLFASVGLWGVGLVTRGMLGLPARLGWWRCEGAPAWRYVAHIAVLAIGAVAAAAWILMAIVILGAHARAWLA